MLDRHLFPLLGQNNQVLLLLTNKPILLDFTGWACVNCRKLEDNVWSNSAIDSIIKKDYIKVNSAHYQAVDKIGKNISISGKSKDGIIESIENNKYKWCIGVQWHPEFLITKFDKLLIKNFIENSR